MWKIFRRQHPSIRVNLTHQQIYVITWIRRFNWSMSVLVWSQCNFSYSDPDALDDDLLESGRDLSLIFTLWKICFSVYQYDMFTSSVSSLRKCSVAVPRSKLLNREPELRKKYIASCLTLIPTMLPDAHPPSLANSLNPTHKKGVTKRNYIVDIPS